MWMVFMQDSRKLVMRTSLWLALDSLKTFSSFFTFENTGILHGSFRPPKLLW